MRFFISLFFSWLIPFAATVLYPTYAPCNPCIYTASSKELAAIELRLYSGPTINNYTNVPIGDALEIFHKIENAKPTVIFIFGFLGRPNDGPTRAIITAYLARGDHNVLLLDWHVIANREVIFAIRSVNGVGYYLARAISKLVERGLNAYGLHIVGHSLGAQIAGYTGRYMNFKLPKITGLDPAGYGFYIVMKPLSYADAQSVFIIHTNDGGFGNALQTGHADFYPNNGINVQPGCISIPLLSDICSHYRSCYYYAESVRNENSLIGIACDSYSDFQTGFCSSNSTAIMGYGTPNNAKGRYYLKTNSKSPYGKSESGINFT